MTMNQKPTGLASPMPGGLAQGGMVSLGMTLILCAVLAKLLDSQMLPQENTGYGIMIIVVLSAWSGAAFASGRIRRRILMVCALSGVIYYGILLSITALFFGGRYSGAGETALLVICGSMLAFLLRIPHKSGVKRRKVKIRNC